MSRKTKTVWDRTVSLSQIVGDPEATKVSPPKGEALDVGPPKETAMEVDQMQVQPLAHDFLMAKVLPKKRQRPPPGRPRPLFPTSQDSRSSGKSKVVQMPPEGNWDGRDRTGGVLSGEEKTNDELLSSAIFSCAQIVPVFNYHKVVEVGARRSVEVHKG